MPIPPFSFEEAVSPEGAKHDKIEIGIEGGWIQGDAEDAWAFLNYLGSPPRHERNTPGIAPYGLFFSRLRSDDPPFRSQTIRGSSFRAGGQRYSRPLFGGWLEVEHWQEEAWRIYVRLSLNPTRFVRHQLMPSRLILFQSPPEFPHFEPNLFQREIGGEHGGEFALVECDNWIPNSRTWQQFTSEAFWPHHLRACLTILPNALLGELRRAVDVTAPATHLEGQWTFNLRSVETYWEFLSPDPLGTVLRLHPMLQAFSARAVTVSDYPCTVELEPSQENSRCLRLETRTGETLKIYAKTNRRIRFEVSHQLCGERGFRVPRGGHTFPAIEGISPLLSHLAGIAAERVNAVLRHFRLHASAPDEQHTVLKFIADVQAACRDPEKAFQLLQILTSNGSIVVGHGIPLGTVFRDELRRLVRREILVTSNQRYSVAPSYRQALNNMRESGIGFLLGTRIRRRPNTTVQH